MITKIKVLLMLLKSLVVALVKAKRRAKQKQNINKMKTGLQLIETERGEQITKHGRTIEKDANENSAFQLPLLADLLITKDFIGDINPEFFPQGLDPDLVKKMLLKTYKDRLVIAGALIAAEIDRLQFDKNAIVTNEVKNETEETPTLKKDPEVTETTGETQETKVKPRGRGINELRKPKNN